MNVSISRVRLSVLVAALAVAVLGIYLQRLAETLDDVEDYVRSLENASPARSPRVDGVETARSAGGDE